MKTIRKGCVDAIQSLRENDIVFDGICVDGALLI